MLDFSEFLGLMMVELTSEDPELLRGLFQVFDRDDNGFITSDELKHCLWIMLDEDQAEKAIESAGLNQHCQIMFEGMKGKSNYLAYHIYLVKVKMCCLFSKQQFEKHYHHFRFHQNPYLDTTNNKI